MEVFYNELSNRPIATNSEEAKGRIIALLETMRSLREYDINIMRAHNNFYAEQLSDEYCFSSFFGDQTVSTNLKTLLQTIVRTPFIEDVDSNEAESFISNTFSTQNHLDETVNPEGLASAWVFSLPVISIGSHAFWRSNSLLLAISNNIKQEVRCEDIPNLFSKDCINSEAFRQWIDYLNPSIPLNSEENIYKVFPNSQYQFDSQAIADILSWFYDDKRYLAKVRELLEDIPNNPFTGGKGKTETLTGGNGKASKRIAKKDRIVYTYTKDKITIHQCREHY